MNVASPTAAWEPPAPDSPARSRAGVTVRVLGAIGFRWLCFAAMTLMAVWNEGRPGTRIADWFLQQVPYVAWVAYWNYWIWFFAYVPWTLLFVVVDQRRFIRLMLAEGLMSLLRGVCIVVTALGPVRGPDVNASLDWNWEMRWRVLTRILDPNAVLSEGSANVWLTKDLFFSGHAATCALLLLYVWPHRWLRWIVAAGNVLVVASLLLGHIHYTIDILGAWIVAWLLFGVLEKRWRP